MKELLTQNLNSNIIPGALITNISKVQNQPTCYLLLIFPRGLKFSEISSGKGMSKLSTFLNIVVGTTGVLDQGGGSREKGGKDVEED